MSSYMKCVILDLTSGESSASQSIQNAYTLNLYVQMMWITVMLKLMSKILNESKILYLKLFFRTKKFVKVDNYPTWPAQKEHTKLRCNLDAPQMKFKWNLGET